MTISVIGALRVKILYTKNVWIVLGFNDTSTSVGHFVVSQRKGEKI